MDFLDGVPILDIWVTDGCNQTRFGGNQKAFTHSEAAWPVRYFRRTQAGRRRLQAYKQRQMSEPNSAAHHPDGAVSSGKRERFRIILVSGAILLVLAAAAAFLRLHRLAEIPPGIIFDEGAHGVDAVQVLQGKHAVFFPANSGREGFIVYAIALTHFFLGPSILALRLTTALSSAAAVLVLFWTGHVFFGTDEHTGMPRHWRGIFIGGVGAALLAISLNHIVLGRVAYRANFLIVLLPLCLALLWRGWRKRSWMMIALAGLCAGIMQYTYIPARLLPVLLLFFGLTYLFPVRDNAMRRLREAWRRAFLFAAVYAVAAAPILIYFARHPEHLFDRISQVTLFSQANTLGGPLGTLWQNAWDHILVFGFHGDPNWIHNYESRPMLSLWEAFFFWLGLGLLVWRWRTFATARLLIMWLGIMLLPALLARNPYPYVPNTLRMMGAAPAVYILIGFAAWEVFQLLRRRVPVVTPALILLVPTVILAQGILSYRTYFEKYEHWARSSEHFRGQWSDAALELSDISPTDGGVYLILSENRFAHYGFDYIYEGDAPVHIVNHRGPGMPYEAGTSRQTLFMLASDEELSTIALLDWDDKLGWNDEEEREMIDLLGRYGRYAGSQQFSSFQIHTFSDLSLQLPWRFYEQLERLHVSYDADISLLGLAIGQDAEQMSSQDAINLDERRPLWVGLSWQTDLSVDADIKISLRLYDAAGAYRYNKDRILRNLNGDTTAGWTPGQPVETLFFLDIPPELPPGEYELRLVVYNAETLIPTVEIDVWEPEFVLARLRLGEDG